MKNQKLTIGRTSTKSLAEILAEENFEAMNYLKENRNWIIRKILEYNTRDQLVDAMHAIKDAVQNCSDSVEADDKVEEIAMLRNFDRGAFVERNQQILRERKRTVFN